MILLGLSGVLLLNCQPNAAKAEVAQQAQAAEQATAAGAERETSIAQAQISITGVRVEPAGMGVQIVLETTGGELTISNRQIVGNALIAEFANAVLALPTGEAFEEFGPAPGIALVSVTAQPEGGVRVSITGTEAAPQVESRTVGGNLALSVTPEIAPTATTDDEAIQVRVTATRTEEDLQNVPRSITVITSEQIIEQTRLEQSLADILSQLVPGFSAPTGRTNTFGQTLRGRSFSVLIDGIPQNTNLGSIPAALTTIDPRVIERIEVVRGPNAIYGGQATGGLINIITRQPDAAPLSQTIDLGGSESFNSAFLTGDGFGFSGLYSLSASTDKASILMSLSYNTQGVYYDANGDRIPSDLTNAETDEFNFLLRLGGRFSPNQRLSFTLNYFNQKQDATYIADPSVDDIDGVQRARAIKVPEDTRVIGAPRQFSLETTNITLQYVHENLLNSELSGQVYFRDYAFVGGIPADNRDFLGFITQSPGSTQQWGGRLQVDTPLNRDDTLSVLWGVDYVRESSSQRFNVFDPGDFDASGGLIYRKTDAIDFVPPYTLSDLGIFAQLKWEIIDRLTLSGGARYINLNADTDDYVTFRGDAVEGGTINADDVVFNIGLAYEFVDRLTIFTSFAQGFSLPDIGRVLRFAPPGFSVETDIDLTEPQKVDNYEIGLRGNWDNVQASVAGFYNYSSLGTRFAVSSSGPLQTVRSPQRVYGVEGSVDWQPSATWKLGGTATWLEGEDDADLDGKFTALDSLVIAPFKLTAYVENETLPGWRNRLQLLYSGSRDRGFKDGADSAAINSYVTLDLLSSVQMGSGVLTLGIQNLLNADYFPVYSQYFAPFFDSVNRAGQGRTVTLTYRLKF